MTQLPHHRRAGAHGEEGVVMLLILVIIVLSISSAISFATSSALEVAGMRHRADRARAALIARSGLTIAYRALKDDLQRGAGSPDANLETEQDPWYLLGEVEADLPDQGRLHVHVRDLGTKVNLNGLLDDKLEPHPESREFLTKALGKLIRNMPGRREDKPYRAGQLADAILDWIDADKRTRLGDRESRYYKGLGSRYGPHNRRLFSIGELGDVPGIDERMLRSLDAYFTVHPVFADLNESGVNPNTAPGWTLSLIYLGNSERRDMIDYRDVLATLQKRAEGRIFCPNRDEDPCLNFKLMINEVGKSVFPPLAFHNRAFEVRSLAHYRETSACVSAVVERRGVRDVRPIAWEMNCG